MSKTIGIDIGGTNFRVGVFEAEKLIDEDRFQANFSTIFKQNSPTKAWHTIVHLIADGIVSVLKQHQDVSHIGIGFPGFIDPKTQCISESPNLPGLKDAQLDKDLLAILSPQYQIKEIHIENDALAAAYGEYCVNESHSLLYFGLGTGVGGGMVICGMAFTGMHGMAMEVGHIIVHPGGRLCGCGNHGCVEQYASATAVELSYYEATKQNASAITIAKLAHQGDQHAKQAFQLAGESLAIAIAHTLKVVDVPTVVIGGGLSEAWDLMQKPFDTTLEANLIPVLRGKINVMTSTLNDTAGMLGAAALAIKPKH